MNPTKKCPMCAEQIPLEATVCEYCGTKFEVTVEAGQPVSRVLEEPVAPPKQAAQSVPASMPAPKHITQWVWIAAGLGALLILALVGGGIMMAQNGLPFLSTPTNTPRPTATPNYAATQQARDQQATTIAQNAWIQDFAQPILDEIKAHSPNFEDDFSNMNGRFARWSYLSGNVTFTEDVMRINTTGHDGVDAGGSMIATNFVLEFEFIPRTASDGSSAVAGFRWNDVGGYDFDFNLKDTWWGMLSIPKEQDVRIVAEGGSREAGLNRRTSVTIIATNDRFAFYANGKPLFYAEDSTWAGDWAYLSVWSPDGPSEVDFDNVKFWDLNNLKP